MLASPKEQWETSSKGLELAVPVLFSLMKSMHLLPNAQEEQKWQTESYVNYSMKWMESKGWKK